MHVLIYEWLNDRVGRLDRWMDIQIDEKRHQQRLAKNEDTSSTFKDFVLTSQAGICYTVQETQTGAMYQPRGILFYLWWYLLIKFQVDLQSYPLLNCFHIFSNDMVFPSGSAVKNLPANAGDVDLVPGSGRFPWSRKWQPTLVFIGKIHRQRNS